MCLCKTHRFPKISRKPIQCYKTFYICKIRNFELSTYICGYRCNVGDTIKSKDCWIWGILESKLEGEVVHAYRNESDIVLTVPLGCSRKPCVCLCEIPPFTPYWIGECGEIGASKLKIIKRIDLK